MRGAGVDVDVRKVGRVLGIAALLALAVATVVLVISGVHHNDQATRLRRSGVPVTMTISGCQGLLGGSGSNAAGYQCAGTFRLSGHAHHELLPGSTLYPPGTHIGVVAVPGDPALVATAAAAAQEHPSWRVFIVPAILGALLVTGASTAVLLHPRTTSSEARRTSSTGRAAP